MRYKIPPHREKRIVLVQVAQANAYGLSQKQIGEGLESRRSQSAVSKLLKEAEEYGVIRKEIDADAALWGIPDKESSARLRKAYELETARVFRVPDDCDTDEVQIALANGIAPSARADLKSFTYVAVAGGRAMARLCEAVGQEPMDVHDVAVTPLGGRLWTGNLWKSGTRHASHLELPLDADDCALRLARSLHWGFQPSISFTQVGHPLFANTEEIAEDVIARNCTFTRGGGWGKFGLGTPNLAFVGIGMITKSVQTHHRLAEWITQKKQGRTGGNESVSIIGEALKRAAAHGVIGFGDVANRLFVCLPLPREVANPKRRAQFTKVIRELDDVLLGINRKSVVMDWRHLRMIKSTTAIAGGTKDVSKLHACWTCLLTTALFPRTSGFGLINSFTTDANTAEGLLQARRELEATGGEVKKWYVDMLELLFPAG